MVNLTKLKEILAIGSADTVGSVISAIFWFYLASQIEPESFGELQWFLGIAAVTSTVALFGCLNVITILYAKKIQLQNIIELERKKQKIEFERKIEEELQIKNKNIEMKKRT